MDETAAITQIPFEQPLVSNNIVHGVAQDLHLNQDLDVVKQLGLAYAVPANIVKNFHYDDKQWQQKSLQLAFEDKDRVFGGAIKQVLIDVVWKCCNANQFIIQANILPQVIFTTPIDDANFDIKFSPPEIYDQKSQAWEIPFSVTLTAKLNDAVAMQKYIGRIRANGSALLLRLARNTFPILETNIA
jgi:hypothetical protein